MLNEGFAYTIIVRPKSVDSDEAKYYHKKTKQGKKLLTAVGFEPTPPKRPGP